MSNEEYFEKKRTLEIRKKELLEELFQIETGLKKLTKNWLKN